MMAAPAFRLMDSWQPKPHSSTPAHASVRLVGRFGSILWQVVLCYCAPWMSKRFCSSPPSTRQGELNVAHAVLAHEHTRELSTGREKEEGKEDPFLNRADRERTRGAQGAGLTAKRSAASSRTSCRARGQRSATDHTHHRRQDQTPTRPQTGTGHPSGSSGRPPPRRRLESGTRSSRLFRLPCQAHQS